MSGDGLVVDAVLLAFVGLAIFRGYQRGLVVSLLGLVGFLGGAIAGLAFGPGLVDSLSTVLRILALLAILLTCANLGQALTLAVARGLREKFLWKPLRVVDSIAGSLFTVVGAVVLLWVVAGVLRISPYQSVTTAVAGSKVVSVIDTVVPDLARQAMAQARQVVNGGSFPNVFSALGPEPYFDSTPPDQSVISTPAITRASKSVARVTGVATSCKRAVEGSGFLIADDLVMTNAHVIAGVENPRIRFNGAASDEAGVIVYFDPKKDVAIIRVDFGPKALAIGTGADRGDDVIVAGFPENGPFTVGAGRIKGKVSAIGWDIYSRVRVTREVFALAADVRPGNSGGPLFAVNGEVIGMVFARSTTDDDTGYALATSELRAALKALGASRTRVASGSCA